MDLWQEMSRPFVWLVDSEWLICLYLSNSLCLYLLYSFCLDFSANITTAGRVVQERWLCLSKYRRSLRLLCKVNGSVFSFQNCIIISFKSKTNFSENICFYHGATDIVLFSQCGWDREVPIQRSLTQF